MNLAISNVLTRKTSNISSLENKGEECAQVDDSPYSSPHFLSALAAS